MRGEYEIKFWYWELIRMYMKLIIMGILIVYENNVPLKVIILYFEIMNSFLVNKGCFDIFNIEYIRSNSFKV